MEEIVAKALGFGLNQYEMISLLRGEWKEYDTDSGLNGSLEKWNLRRDEKGRVTGGQREDLRFEIKEFIEDSKFARLVLFQHPWSEGQLKILRIGFNQPINPAAFSHAFLERFKSKTWPEIEELLNNEN